VFHQNILTVPGLDLDIQPYTQIDDLPFSVAYLVPETIDEMTEAHIARVSYPHGTVFGKCLRLDKKPVHLAILPIPGHHPRVMTWGERLGV
jgi:hypothetical protein